jgi:hypothetical protein
MATDTAHLLRQALSKMDELQHRLSAAEKREARERADAQHRADEARYLTSREHLLDVQATARKYQARADDALSTWGIRAPAFVAGESLDEYRRRLARLAQRQLPDDHEFRHLKISRMDDDVFTGFEPQFYAATKEAGTKPDSAAPGQMRMVEKVNPQNGQKFIEWLGSRSFIHDMKSPVRRVLSFRTEQGPVHTSKGYLR